MTIAVLPTSAPVAVSVTPSSGTGASQTFAFVYSNAAGASAITYAVMTINDTLNWAGSCTVDYTPGSNQLWLLNDAGSSWLGPLTPHVAGTVQNNQCTLDAFGSSADLTGATLTLNLALSFQPAFQGTKNIYMQAGNQAGGSSDYTAKGTWMPYALGAPVAASVTPSGGTGASPTFTFVYTNGAGASAITYAVTTINDTLNWVGSCTVDYVPGSNQLWLLNDAGDGWQGPLTPTNTGTVANRQCTLDGSGSSATASGPTLTLKLALSFPASFQGTKNIYMQAANQAGLSSDYAAKGTWTPYASEAPVAVSVTPGSGTGPSQMFTYVYSNAAGASAITYAVTTINDTLSWVGSCTVDYVPGSNQLWLLNDAGSDWLGPLTPQVAGTVQNSQCTLNASDSSADLTGTTLTLNLGLSFQPSFQGTKNIYMQAANQAGLSSAYAAKGSWTPYVSQAPVAVSVTPGSGSGSSQMFTYVYSNGAGASAITYAVTTINDTLNWVGSCTVDYTPGSNQLWLLMDDASGWLGPMTPGSAGTLQNSQCTLNGTGSTVNLSGPTLTLNLALSFQSAFQGTKNIYMQAGNQAGLTSDYAAKGTWTVQ